MRVILIEDEPAQLEWVRGILQPALPEEAALRTYASGETFWNEGWLPDIAVVDIRLPGQTGIQLARRLNREAPACQVIFISAFAGYAADVYEAQHVWFVPKDRLAERLPQAVAAARTRLEQLQKHSLVLNYKGKTLLLPCGEIQYVERQRHTTAVAGLSERYPDRRRLSELLAELEPGAFARCHESFLVNLSQIRQLQRTELLLRSGVRLPVSRKYSAALRDRFAAFLRDGR